MAYEAKDYSYLVGMEGFSETLLRNHFTLYQGYVTNTNKLLDLLTRPDYIEAFFRNINQEAVEGRLQ